MAINLPQDGYAAMAMINHLANSGAIAGVSYEVKKKNGKNMLVGIRAQIGIELEVNPPSPIIMAKSGMIKLGGKGSLAG
jgi:hypothetical protein